MLKLCAAVILFVNLITYHVYAISAHSAILIDAGSGRVLYEHNAYEKLPMASTTKIMTGLISCESGKFNEIVKISPFASGTEGSSLWLKPEEKLALKELTYGLMLKSGNDSAIAIAEHLCGNVKAFSVLMTQRAKEIGAMNTSFKNPHGLDEEGHYTTAYDLAIITMEAMKNVDFRKIVSTKNYSIPESESSIGRTFKNHNKMLWYYEGCNGVKTGFTKKCGRCLVTSAEREGQELICVTLNAPDDWNDHTFLLNYGFENFQTKTIAKKGDKALNFTHNKKYKKSVDLIYEEDFKIAVGNNDLVTTNIKLNKISKPLEKGSVAGVMEVYCNGEKVKEINLLTLQKINKISILEKIKVNFLNLFK